MFEDLTLSINNSKYFYAITMILLNMGAKYLEMDLVDSHRQFLSSKAIRRIIIFTVSFVATRDVVASLIITASFVILVLNLFNENSEYCVIPKTLKKLDSNNDGEISPEEIKKAYDILKKAGKIKE
jgi:hypothetical protein|tara:strand:+ start:2213 stop:2590 length:378 start_codon:yes stop_codon:yes gene_type:complete